MPWHTQQPNNAHEKQFCLAIGESDFLFDDTHCYEKHEDKFICQFIKTSNSENEQQSPLRDPIKPENNSNSTLLWALLSIAGVACILGVGWYFWRRYNRLY
jgi:hypothetical protein